MIEIKFQIGKNGVTEGVIDSLALAFKNHKNIRISTLKSSGRDKESIKKMAEDIVVSLKSKTKDSFFSYKIIGFTIILRKNNKPNK